MSSIYDLKSKQIRKELKNFSKCYYGKMIYLTSFLLPSILFMIALILVILDFISGLEAYYSQSIQVIIIIATISFVLGTMFFYRELRTFVNFKMNKNSK